MKKNVVIFFEMLIVVLTTMSATFAQTASSRFAVIGFYNTENLFDTEDDPLTIDEEFLPNGVNQWTVERYQVKLDHLAKVIALIGQKQGGVVALGLSEIENRRVMEDLVNTEPLRTLGYGVVHHDSPDRRGVDVGLIYRKNRFAILGQRAFRLYTADTSFRTRDQLLISGVLDHIDTLHILVNHWPSKRGGEKRSMPARAAAAQLSRHIADSLFQQNPMSKLVIMGDLNDNPTARSLTEFLRAKSKTHDLQPGDLFNPMHKMYKDGIGSYAYRDNWDLIDMTIVSYGLMYPKSGTYRYSHAEVFRANFLLTPTGAFTGYPFRTYAGGTYQGGYSDHLPVYLILTNEQK
ncbi:MAG: endonuclease/exonuclease/phosphatase family protein [Bacteroidales bacterium]|nr:endonuclease/exonuclease/phosphatase family protein [Bacteroidales bacterium]